MEAKARNCLTREEKKTHFNKSRRRQIILRNCWYFTTIKKRFLYRVISRFNTEKTLELKPRTGSTPMTIKREDRMIVKMSLKDRFDVAKSISRAFCYQTGKPISRKTVSRRLDKEKFVARIPCRKPLISKKNHKVRFDFAAEHIWWTLEQWNMVPFSDESKFNLFESDGKRFVRRKNGERLSPQCVKKTVKFGGESVMVWGIISSAGVGPTVRFRGNINASVYKEVLRQRALPHLRKGTVRTPIFMQDNAPCTKLKLCYVFLRRKE